MSCLDFEIRWERNGFKKTGAEKMFFRSRGGGGGIDVCVCVCVYL